MFADDVDMENDHEKPQVTVLVFNAAGCLLLSVLTVSLGLSKRLQRRDPVVNNFLYTWILQSGLATFDELVLFSGNTLDSASFVREFIPTMITLVSTLNLSIHLFFVMRSAFHDTCANTRKARSALLVISPYVIGLLPVGQLFFPRVGELISEGTAFAIAILTPFVDISVLIYYIRWYDKTKKAKVKNFISLSFCIRLLIFSLHRLLYIVLLFLGTVLGSKRIYYIEAFSIVQNLFPLLAFFVIGLHFDILSLWFPFLSRFRPRSTHIFERQSNVSFYDFPHLGRQKFRYINIDPMGPDS